MRILPAILAAAVLAGCSVSTGTAPTSTSPSSQGNASARLPASQATANFRSVVRRMEPVAERECRRRRPGANCDFLIVVDERADQPPNAFQTLNEDGRPVIGFNVALIAEARNSDEIAFVLGHEAAHHIEAHIPKTQERAVGGAVLGTVLAGILGANQSGVEAAQRIGGTVGARSYSKEFELEADALGTVITHLAGYDPVRGAEFFNRIPDPGDRFLGTHPPNAERIATVRRTAEQL